METLVTNDIYTSISGEVGALRQEVIKQGDYLTIIRLQGCNLKCSWCDAPDAWAMEDGLRLSVPSIFEQIKTKKVMITGGEPLTQMEGLTELLKKCVHANMDVQVETNGSLPLYPPDPVFHNVGWVVDYKCPSSGMASRMPGPEYFTLAWSGYWHMITKFVVADEEDLNYAMVNMVRIKSLMGYAQFGISPVDAEKGGIKKAIKFFEEKAPQLLDCTTFSLQLHKIAGMA